MATLTSATVTSAPVAPHVPPLTTPQILWRALWAIWILDVILLIALLNGSRVHREGMQKISKDAAPSIIAAQQIKTALADMDANAANELLGEPGRMPEANKAYENRRREAAKALIAAAGNITYEDRERDPILKIQLGIGDYEARIQKAHDLHGEHNAGFVGAYNAAAELMDGELLPAADQLSQVNLQELENTYESQSRWSAAARGFILAAAVVTLAFLAFVQNLLAKRTRRLINLPLLLATGVTVGCAFYALHALTVEQGDLRAAKEDAFASVHALWQAKAAAYAANADESRFLLDRANAAKHAQAFFTKRDRLITPPQGESVQSLAQATRLNLDGSKGYLADELKNVTFPGEREAATEALRAFGEYLQADEKIRTFQGSGRYQEAVNFCIGTKPGESNWAFAQFDKALDDALQINQKEFQKSVGSGFAALAHFDVAMSICAVLAGVLTLFGLLQRIREYR